MQRLVALACVLAVSGMARAPSGLPPDLLRVKLQKFAAETEDLHEHLPSFGCKETLISQEVRGDKVKKEMRATGDLRVQRDPGGKLVEHFQATEVNGKPTSSQILKLPIFVSGGFKNALDLFQADIQACFQYSISGDRLDFESVPVADLPRCANHSETRGFALLDGNGDVMHLERRVPVELARERNSVPFGAIDLSRVELGGRSFLLSTHVSAEIIDGKSTYHWEATYTDCRLFAATVKILPVPEPGPGNAGSGAESVRPHP